MFLVLYTTVLMLNVEPHYLFDIVIKPLYYLT